MSDMDLDLDDLDAPIPAPSRATRFAPKNSKFKPIPKPKQEPIPTEQSPAQPQESNLIPLKKNEESDSLPSFVDSATAKTEYEPSRPSSATAEMDVDGEETKAEPIQEDDAEDQVVREIDVFFTPAIDTNTQLYVLQYPLRPCWRPYELDELCEEVRVKPTSTEIEVDLSVDVDSKNYDPDFRTRMAKQTLSTSWKPTCTTGYAVGVLMGNKLCSSDHLRNISNLVAQRRRTMRQAVLKLQLDLKILMK